MADNRDGVAEFSFTEMDFLSRRDISGSGMRPRAPALLLLALAGCATVMFSSALAVPSEAFALLAVVMLVLLLLLKIPVGLALAIPGVIGIWALRGSQAAIVSLREVPYVVFSGFTLSVLPMFIFMGFMLWRSKTTENIYKAAKVWLNRVPGGLAVTTNAAGAALGATSGSTIAITYAVGRIAIPEMLKEGYDKRLALGSVLMAGTGGQLLPPSILLVVYAGVAEQSIGDTLLAGVVPGIILAVAYALMIILLAVAIPGLISKPTGSVASAAAPVTWTIRLQALALVWPVPILIGTVIGGIYGGIFTATEAGAFGALASIGIGITNVGFKTAAKAALWSSNATVSSMGSVMFLLLGAGLFNRLIIISGGARWLASLIDQAGLGRISFLLALVVLFLFLGLFMDPIGMMLVAVPVLLPAVTALDINLLWFGAFVVLLGEISILTPPLGILAFVLHGIAQDPEVNLGHPISIGDVFTSVLWFLPITLVVLLLLIFFPDLALWLPNSGSSIG